MIYGASSVDGTTTNTTSNTKNSVTNPNEAQDRFLKLLVAQLNNQDPMNPMDNAEMTSQMAQINTVTGIQQLNQTMASMSSQFTAMQVLQGTSMIGRTVLTEGNTLGVAADGTHTAAFDLENQAASVKIQITTASGELVDTIDLGPALPGGTTSPGMARTNTAAMPRNCATAWSPPMARPPWHPHRWRRMP